MTKRNFRKSFILCIEHYGGNSFLPFVSGEELVFSILENEQGYNPLQIQELKAHFEMVRTLTKEIQVLQEKVLDDTLHKGDCISELLEKITQRMEIKSQLESLASKMRA